MARIISSKEADKTVIQILPELKRVFICLPYIALFVGVTAVTVAALWRILLQVTHAPQGGSSPIAAIVVGGLFGFQSFRLGRGLSIYIGLTGRIVIQGAALSIQRGKFWMLSPEETYSASSINELRWEGKRGFLQTGKVVATIGNTPLTIAAGLDDTDGNRLVDLLTDAYPFSTPDAAPSPYVVQW